jgi:DNA replication and repair protein RecF
MRVKSIKLTNYRNYINQNWVFSPATNIILGKNAQGKTNLLEAIFTCAIGKSLRANRDIDVIKWGEDNAKIELEIEKKFGKAKIEIFFFKSSKKAIKINGLPIKRIGELLGEFRCVFFAPDELKLIKESPEDRRRFMDIAISQTSKNYFYLLGKYEKIISSRNKLLKEYKDKLNLKKNKEIEPAQLEDLKRMISVYDQQLAECASRITIFRNNFVFSLAPLSEKAHSYITNNSEFLKVNYDPSIKLDSNSLLEQELLPEITNKFFALYQKNFDKDLSLGYTINGPHRDDIKVLINDIDARSFCSQGQQRTAALSLKLAELEIIKNQTGEMPVLILDDVLSELDSSRRNRLLKFCALTQTFISSTDKPEKIPNASFIKIDDSKNSKK